MRINNYYLSFPGVTLPVKGQPPEATSTAGVSAPSVEQVSSHTLSPELLHVIGLARQQPEVRPEVVQQVRERMAQGVYATSTSAESTAQAILASKDEG